MVESPDPAHLPLNPPNVHMPTEVELDFAGVSFGGWSRSKCITCGGLGTYQWYGATDDEVITWACDCEEQLVLSRWFGVSGLGLAAQQARQRDLIGATSEAMTWARSYFADIDMNLRRGIGCVLRGKTGRGKTLLATLMLKQAALRGSSIYSFNAGTDLKFLATKGGWPEDKRQWVEHKLRAADVLLLDDIDESSAPHWMDGSVSALIRYRQMAMRPTYIAVKNDDSEIASRFGASAIDLIHSVGDVITLTLSDTWRPQAANRRRDEAKAGLRRPVVFA